MDHALPGFDLPTMQGDWKDFLSSQCGYDTPPVALVAELVRQHTVRFSAAVTEAGLKWDPLDGSFALDGPVPPGVVLADHPLAYESVSAVWTAAFEAVRETLDETEQLLIP
ncbi:hypothetical protein ACFRNJ_12295 [Streptomyces sp. NPDC056721]|uniref:hypothetical protein n=1 Tax=Streptomyces sp. NPDC056721 TaxID=3345923 RepID=UPI0036CCEA7C